MFDHEFSNVHINQLEFEYESGHEGAAVLLPGFAINW